MEKLSSYLLSYIIIIFKSLKFVGSIPENLIEQILQKIKLIHFHDLMNFNIFCCKIIAIELDHLERTIFNYDIL